MFELFYMMVNQLTDAGMKFTDASVNQNSISMDCVDVVGNTYTFWIKKEGNND